MYAGIEIKLQLRMEFEFWKIICQLSDFYRIGNIITHIISF